MLAEQSTLILQLEALDAPEGGSDGIEVGGNVLRVNRLAPLIAFYLLITSFNNIKRQEGLSL